MSKLRVIKYGNPILRMKAERIETIDARIQQLAKEMVEIMLEEEGIGLAAPQVAQSIQLLVVDHSLIEEEGKPKAYINPAIIETEGESVMEEGCLSLPDIHEEVKRPDIIKLRYQDISGDIFEERADGLLARVLQHEIDHLRGVLFIDRISSMRRQLLNKKLKAIADAEKELMAEVA